MGALSDQLSGFVGEGAEFTETSVVQDERVAPGKRALASSGVLYQAPWRVAADGMGRHARATVKALVSAGVPIRLDSTLLGDSPLSEDLSPSLQQLEYLSQVTFESTVLRIRHDVFSDLAELRRVLFPFCSSFVPEEQINNLLKKTVLYTSWERDRVPSDCVPYLNRLGGVWLPCSDNVSAFVRSGVRSDIVKELPFCYDPHEPIYEPLPGELFASGKSQGYRSISGSACIPLPFGREDCPQDKRFYSIGKWEPRKNQHRILGAFLLAFTPKDRASLFFKTGKFGAWRTYPSPKESISQWLSDPRVQRRGWTSEKLNRLVRIVDKVLPESDLVEIHRRNNIYISAGHGEAWDLPAFDAKLAGNRLVYTDWGGPREFTGSGDISLGYTYAPVDPDYGWGKANWAEVSTQDLRQALLDIRPPEIRVQDPSLYTRFGQHSVGVEGRILIEGLCKIERGWG